MNVYLIRHGEPELLNDNVYRGHSDLSLSETGLRQAELLDKRLSDAKIGAIYSSPLKRAVQTVEPLSKSLNLEIQRAESINDVDFGSWTGLTVDEVIEKYPSEFEKWQKTPLDSTFDSGYSIRELQKNVVEWLNDIVNGEYEAVTIATHKILLRLIVMSIIDAGNDKFFDYDFETCSISVIENEGNGFVVKSLNDTSHLEILKW